MSLRYSQGASPSVRTGILLVSLVIAGAIAWGTTGSVLPQDPQSSLVFQNSLLLIVLGSSLLETYYTKPADSLVNALAGAVTLVGVKHVAPPLTWWLVFSYCVLILVLASICVFASSHRNITGWRRKAATATYGPAVTLGASRVLHSILFLFGLFSFYETDSLQMATYLLFWGLYVVIWPLGLPEWLSRLGRREGEHRPIGHIARTDWPGLVRVKIEAGTKWDCSSPKIIVQADGHQRVLAPLYTAPHGEDLIGTGLCLDSVRTGHPGLEVSCVYDIPTAGALCERDIARAVGGTDSSRLVGFVVEDSKVASIRFETWTDTVHQGMLVWCPMDSCKIHYQITDGVTHEESFQADRQGRRIAEASQVGVLVDGVGFTRYPWLPRMNTPVFTDGDVGAGTATTQPGDFTYGTIPGTALNIGGPFTENMTYHTAILGVTGAGKTELAFDMLRHAIQQGAKVICIDLTARYKGRLCDLSPADLSITAGQAKDLNDRLFDVETGTYGAKKEKEVLKQFTDTIRGSVSNRLISFLREPTNLGVITLHEISNTDATLLLTEVYLTALLNYARDYPESFPRTLIVVEEAHTVMPEPTLAGVGSYEARGLVGKISQIALQGRKYGIGLLVIAQRTATVSKSVLTQCNTVISFACFDNTSMEFLGNVFGTQYASMLPNLAPLQMIAYGKAVRSQRPVMVQIPFDPDKVNP